MTVEMLIFAPCQAEDVLLDLLNHILVHCDLPVDCRTTHFIMLANHIHAKTVDEFRPIALLKMCYKVYARLINSRARKYLDKSQPPSQARFKKDFSIDDHLLALTLLLERVHEYNLKLWAVNLDLSKAFDRVNWNKL